MTPDRLRDCMTAIGWGGSALSEVLGINRTSVSNWMSGKFVVPQNVADWIERLAAAHDAYPLPMGWEERR